MKAVYYSFCVFIKQIKRDDMLWAVCFAPILAGLFFRFAVPVINRYLAQFFAGNNILIDYYLLIDLLLCLLTPYMFCFASAMVMLTEYDENIAIYTAITPVGKSGYILSRLVLPALISVPAAMLFTSVFSLTGWTFIMLLITSMLCSLLSIAVAMLLVSISNNRVEGMALAKMSGLIMIGLPLPFFLTSYHQYYFSLLPSFWIARLVIDQNIIYAVPALVTAILWIILLYSKFNRKLSG